MNQKRKNPQPNQKPKPKKINFDLESYKDKNYLTHNFHTYPAKFVPQIPKIVIEKFTKKNLTIKRPGNGISPMKFFKILGSSRQTDAEFKRKCAIMFVLDPRCAIFPKSG